MSALDEILRANAHYAETEHPRDLAPTPSRHVAVVTCMDCRIDPYAALGLTTGEVHILRNAGGIVTDDTLRSLIVSHHLLGTEEALVIMHTDCGMAKYTDDEIQAKVRERHEGAPPRAYGAFASVEDAIAEGVERIKGCELLPETFRVSGLVFDVTDGRLRLVA